MRSSIVMVTVKNKLTNHLYKTDYLRSILKSQQYQSVFNYFLLSLHRIYKQASASAFSEIVKTFSFLFLSFAFSVAVIINKTI